jgi:hypothetical protein
MKKLLIIIFFLGASLYIVAQSKPRGAPVVADTVKKMQKAAPPPAGTPKP